MSRIGTPVFCHGVIVGSAKFLSPCVKKLVAYDTDHDVGHRQIVQMYCRPAERETLDEMTNIRAGDKEARIESMRKEKHDIAQDTRKTQRKQTSIISSHDSPWAGELLAILDVIGCYLHARMLHIPTWLRNKARMWKIWETHLLICRELKMVVHSIK